MRFITSVTAALLGLALASSVSDSLAAPASPRFPRLVTHVGRFQTSELSALSSPAGELDLDKAARVIFAEKTGRPDLSLGASSVVALATGERVVKMPQMHKGLRVMGGGATVTFDADNVARMVAAKLVDGLPDDITPSIDAAAAASLAEAASGLLTTPERSKLVIWLAAGSPVLAWVTAPQAVPGIPYAPVVIVDARTGELVGQYNAAVTVIPQGNIYASNPTKSPNLMPSQLALLDGAKALTNELIDSKNCVDKKTTKSVMGFQIHVCELEHSEVADAAGDFLLPFPGDTAPEDPFSQVQMFHHTNKAYDFFRAFQPAFDVNPGFATPMTSVSNLRTPDFSDFANLGNVNKALVPFQNAFFSPDDQLFGSIFGTQGPAMYFGQGPVRDYGYDGDVIYHEFAHGAVNATLQLEGFAHLDKYGASHSNGGMNEGLADYFSSAITGDPDVGEYAAKDFDPSLTSIRSLANPDKIPTALGGEVHQDATFFSGAIWDVRSKLSPTDASRLDGAIFAAMQKVPPPADLGYDELANLFVQSVETSQLGKTVADQLTAAFTARGVLPEALRVLEYTGTTLTGPKELGNGLWFALGTSTTQTKGYAPGILQFHAALLERTTSMTVTFEKVDIGGGSPLGPMGTPFKPKLIVKFGADPLTFASFNPVTPDGDAIEMDPTAAGNDYTAEIMVPEGALSAYIMIGNSGQLDGAYTNFDMTSIQAPDPTGAGGGGGAGGAGASDGTGGAASVKEDSGCGCAIPGSSSGALSSAAFVSAAAALALSRLRRRNGRRAS